MEIIPKWCWSRVHKNNKFSKHREIQSSFFEWMNEMRHFCRFSIAEKKLCSFTCQSEKDSQKNTINIFFSLLLLSIHEQHKLWHRKIYSSFFYCSFVSIKLRKCLHPHGSATHSECLFYCPFYYVPILSNSAASSTHTKHIFMYYLSVIKKNSFQTRNLLIYTSSWLWSGFVRISIFTHFVIHSRDFFFFLLFFLHDVIFMCSY